MEREAKNALLAYTKVHKLQQYKRVNAMRITYICVTYIFVSIIFASIPSFSGVGLIKKHIVLKNSFIFFPWMTVYSTVNTSSI